MTTTDAPQPSTGTPAACETASPSLDIRLLGVQTVQVGGSPLPKLRSRQGYRLLALLALRHGRAVERAFLASALWPHSTEEDALALLRRSLTDLRTALGEAVVRLEAPTRHTLRLNLEAPACLDVLEFERAAALSPERDNLDRAVGLYRGPLLEDYSDDWVLMDRARLEGVYYDVLLARRALGPHSGEDKLSAPMKKRFQTLDTPGNDTPFLARTVRPAGESGEARKGSLPLYPNRFIGRDSEVRSLSRLLGDTEKRLITVTGMGGAGKTRLAVQVAGSLRQQFPGGIFFVSLSDIVSPVLLPQTLAGAIGLTVGASGSLTERIATFLSNSPEDRVPRLLIVDNCEHLIHGSDGSNESHRIGAFLEDLLTRTAPNLTILATSREALHIPGETTFPLKPFPAASAPARSDTPGDMLDTREAGGHVEADSMRLFVERAQEARADFLSNARNTEAIAAICNTLDGLPLAIELAASWTPMLSPQQIAERLKRADAGQRDVLVHRQHVGSNAKRQYSLNATLAWSYQILAPTHQTVLALLSVFRGGWDIDAAEAVYSAAEGSEAGETSTLFVLSDLKDRSLVVVESESVPQTRYRFLETIRVFARHKLSLRPEIASIAAECHALYYAELAAKAAPGLLKADEQAQWLQRLKTDSSNIEAALDWYQNRADGTEALDLCSNLQGYWEATGALAEGYDRMTAALAKTTLDGPDLLRARVLSNAGSFAWQRGNYGVARAHYDEAKAICQAIDETGLLAAVLSGLANVTYYEGDHDTAFTLYEQSLTVARQAGDMPRIALTLGNLGVFAQRRDEYTRAIALFEEQLALRRAIGNPARIAITLSNLATSLDSNGQTVEAEAALAEAEAIFRAIGYRTHLPYVLRMRGVMARAAKEFAVAEARFREAITLEHEGDLKNDLLESLTEYALLKSLTGEPQEAARLLGAIAAAQEHFGFTAIKTERCRWTVENCTKVLSTAEVDALMYQGRLLTLDAAVAIALA